MVAKGNLHRVQAAVVAVQPRAGFEIRGEFFHHRRHHPQTTAPQIILPGSGRAGDAGFGYTFPISEAQRKDLGARRWLADC